MDIRAIATAAVAALLTTPAMAVALPTWSIADICREDSAPGQCSMFERRAQNVVASSWDLLPPDVQAACSPDTRLQADRSWRGLAGCIEIETLRLRSSRAIATRDTPDTAKTEAPAAAAPSAPATPAPASEPATSN